QRILYDKKTATAVGHMLMPASANWHALIEIFAIIKRLAQLLDVGLAVELDAELPAHEAAPAVATDHIGSAQHDGRAIAALGLGRHAILVLLEGDELATVAQRDARQHLRDPFQQRLERVWRDQLIPFARLAAVLRDLVHRL